MLQTQITDLMKTKSNFLDFAWWKQNLLFAGTVVNQMTMQILKSTEVPEGERSSISLQLSQRHSVLGFWEESNANYTEANTIFIVIA